MKKLLLMLALCLPLCAAAQNGKFKKFEFEIGGGYPFAAAKKFPFDGGGTCKVDKVSGRMVVYLEGRWNLRNVPVDIGMHVNVSSFKREGREVELYFEDSGPIMALANDEFNSVAVLPFADYSFRRGKKVNPFVGLGAGIVFSNTNTGVFNDGFETNFCIMPRAGVRFFRHITVAIDYELSKKQYSHASLKIGVSF